MSGPGTDSILNPQDTTHLDDLYGRYALLRRAHPFYRTNGWVVLSRHDDVLAALKNEHMNVAFWSSHIQIICTRLGIALPHKAALFIKSTLLVLDDPEHLKQKKIMIKLFSSTTMQMLRAWSKEEVCKLFSACKRDEIDLVHDVGGLLWVNIFSRWLGLNEKERLYLEATLPTLRLFVDPASLNETNLPGAINALQNVQIFFEKKLKQSRRHDSENYFSMLRDCCKSMGNLTDEEMALSCITVLTGGGETTQALIGNSFFLLSRHPEQLNLVTNDSALLTSAIAEVLRFESPLQFTQRQAIQDTQISEHDIKKGDRFLLCLGSANRDEKHYGPEADTFNILRTTKSSLAFGHGPRNCLGQALAKMQAEVALSYFLSINSAITLCNNTPEWDRSSPLLRKLKTLKIRR